MSLNPLALFEKLINEHGSSAVQRERAELARDQFQSLEKTHNALLERFKELEEDKADLDRLVADMAQQLKQLQEEQQRKENNHEQRPREDQFKWHRGVLFLQLPSGKFEDTVYCPDCNRPMFSLGNSLPFSCERCDTNAAFDGHALPGILAELNPE